MYLPIVSFPVVEFISAFPSLRINFGMANLALSSFIYTYQTLQLFISNRSNFNPTEFGRMKFIQYDVIPWKIRQQNLKAMLNIS